MKPSASPNPASGPVRGLTWPILMTRLCAFAGMRRSTAGAASAPMPAFTKLRRETADMRSLKCILSRAGIFLLPSCPIISDSSAPPRGFEVPEHAGAQLGLLLRRPSAKAFASFDAELALCNELFEIRRRAGPRVDRRQHGPVDRERQVGADEVGVLQRAEHRESAAERGLDHRIDGFGIADVVLDQRDRLAPQRVLQPVADEARYVLLHANRRLADIGVE